MHGYDSAYRDRPVASVHSQGNLTSPQRVDTLRSNNEKAYCCDKVSLTLRTIFYIPSDHFDSITNALNFDPYLQVRSDT